MSTDDRMPLTPWAINLIRVVAALLAIGVGYAAIRLSFSTLKDIATRAHVPADQAWLWPGALDGATVLATLGVVVGSKREKRFFWGVLAGGLLISIIANDLHAILPPNQELPLIWRAVVGWVAPIFGALTIHGFTILLRMKWHRGTAKQPSQAPASATSVVAEQATAETGALTTGPDTSAAAPVDEPAPAPALTAPATQTGKGKYADLAGRVLSVVNVKGVAADDVSEVLRMSYDLNMANRDIGRRLSIGHHTVGKIIEASAAVLRGEPIAVAS